jgi:hypothetical protein
VRSDRDAARRLGVGTVERVGYSALHCDGGSEVRDEAGRPIGHVWCSHNNRAGQPSSGPQDRVIDYEAIGRDTAGAVTNLLARAFTRPLITEPDLIHLKSLKRETSL